MNTGWNKKSKKDICEKRKYTLKLCKTEIGVLKAALHYYLMIDNFGYSAWSIGGGPIGSRDWAARLVVAGSKKSDGLLQVLDYLSPIKPDFGTNTDRESIYQLLKREVDAYEQKAKELKEIEHEHTDRKKKQKTNDLSK